MSRSQRSRRSLAINWWRPSQRYIHGQSWIHRCLQWMFLELFVQTRMVRVFCFFVFLWSDFALKGCTLIEVMHHKYHCYLMLKRIIPLRFVFEVGFGDSVLWKRVNLNAIFYLFLEELPHPLSKKQWKYKRQNKHCSIISISQTKLEWYKTWCPFFKKSSVLLVAVIWAKKMGPAALFFIKMGSNMMTSSLGPGESPRSFAYWGGRHFVSWKCQESVGFVFCFCLYFIFSSLSSWIYNMIHFEILLLTQNPKNTTHRKTTKRLYSQMKPRYTWDSFSDRPWIDGVFPLMASCL